MKKLLFSLMVAGLAVSIAQAESPKETFDKSCAKCHGVDGAGKTKMGEKLGIKDYTDAKVQAELKDEPGVKAIKEGIKKDERTLMKPTEGLSDVEMKALVTYMRSFKK